MLKNGPTSCLPRIGSSTGEKTEQTQVSKLTKLFIVKGELEIPHKDKTKIGNTLLIAR